MFVVVTIVSLMCSCSCSCLKKVRSGDLLYGCCLAIADCVASLVTVLERFALFKLASSCWFLCYWELRPLPLMLFLIHCKLTKFGCLFFLLVRCCQLVTVSYMLSCYLQWLARRQAPPRVGDPWCDTKVVVKWRWSYYGVSHAIFLCLLLLLLSKTSWTMYVRFRTIYGTIFY